MTRSSFLKFLWDTNPIYCVSTSVCFLACASSISKAEKSSDFIFPLLIGVINTAVIIAYHKAYEEEYPKPPTIEA